MDKRWKATERRVAAGLGGTRIPVTGRGRGDSPDIAHALWAPEVKDRASLPAWLLDAMAQAKASVRGQQVPVVVLHGKGMRHADNLVILRQADFEALYGALQEATDGS